MTTDFNEITLNFRKELATIENENANILERAKKVIIRCQKFLSKLKTLIVSNGFKTIPDEIAFFKNTKQIPLVPLIYYSEVRSFELQYPKADRDAQKIFTKKKLEKLNRFFTVNIDFEQYINNGFTHFDKQYYTRNFLDHFHIISSKFYFQDPDYTTARDMLYGKVMAYRKFVKYLEAKLHPEVNGSSANEINGVSQNLQWTSSKTALTELVYALHYNRVINNGNSDLIEIATVLQKVLQFDLGDIYKTFQDIKNRKNSRTLFLDQLSTTLLLEMDKSEE